MAQTNISSRLADKAVRMFATVCRIEPNYVHAVHGSVDRKTTPGAV
jgi:hypothetical protein